jgi:hypothetical protein
MCPLPGAGTSAHVPPFMHGLPAQPFSSTQPFTPRPGGLPCGVKPAPHVHVYEPAGVFEHVAFALQSLVFGGTHSFVSVQPSAPWPGFAPLGE